MQSGSEETGATQLAGRPTTCRGATDSAELHLARGSALAALETGRVAMELIGTPSERAGAAFVTGRALLLCRPAAEGRALLSAEAAVAARADPAIAALMLAHVAASAIRSGLPAEALAKAESAVAIGQGTTERVEVLTRATLASVLVADSQTARGWELLPSPEEIVGVLDPAMDGRLVATTVGLALVWGEALDRAAELLSVLDTVTRRTGTVSVLPSVLMPMALLAHRRCSWHEAEALATESVLLARRADQTEVEPMASAVLTTVEAALGRAVSCRARALSLLDSPAGSVPVIRSAALSALGLLELGEGRLEAAAHWFEVLAASVPGADRPHPGVIMWEADLADTYIGLGRREQARRTLERLEARSLIARSGRASSAALRGRAALAEDDDHAEAMFAEALNLYEGAGRRFAQARTLMAMGDRRLKAGRLDAARDALTAAAAEFDALGATGWSRRVVELMARLADQAARRPPDTQPLTPTEAQVAMAAGLGADVSSIASGLFIPEDEAAAHLRRAMDKLGVEDPSVLALSPLVHRLTAGAASPAVGAPVEPALVAGSGSASGPPPPVTPPGAALPAAPPAAAEEGSSPGVTIRMLGGFAVETAGRQVPAGDGITAQAVKMVALAGKVPVEELIDRLWEDGDADVGRTRLRSLLARMRRQLGPVLERSGSWVILADHVTVDVEVFERHAQEAQVAAAAGDERAGELAELAADLYTGELLPTDRHLDFTAGPRERLRRRYLSVVDLATDFACRQQLLESAVRRLEGAIAADPYDEHLYIKAAGILAGAGRPSEALSMIRRAEAALAELGMSLGQEAVELRVRVRRDASTRP